MSEEKHSLQRQADRARANGARSVLTYLIILFAAAIILLLLAFFMQQRNNEAALNGLQDSITSFESLDELIDENRDLRAQLDEAQTQAEDLQSQLNNANRLNEELQDSYEEYVSYTRALYTLYTAEMKAEEKDYAGAAALFADWDPVDLTSLIGQYDAKAEENQNDINNFSLLSRYEVLITSLVDKGYLGEEYSEPLQTND